jgi:hypothetical protein
MEIFSDKTESLYIFKITALKYYFLYISQSNIIQKPSNAPLTAVSSSSLQVL